LQNRQAVGKNLIEVPFDQAFLPDTRKLGRGHVYKMHANIDRAGKRAVIG
jgi:hypothetical protein